DSFITLPDIFNNINLLPPSDYKDDDSIINNINLYQISCNYNNSIVNTNLLSPFTEYNDNQFSNYGNNSSLFDDDNPSLLFEDSNNSSLFEDDDNFNTSSSSLTENDNNPSISYQYNLNVGNYFDDWSSVDRFIHNYCLEQGFGYQIFCNDKDPNDPSITHRKSFRYLSSGTYEPRKSTHNHELNPTQICDIIARYRHFNEKMMQDIKFFSDYKVAPITQLEMFKIKYPQNVYHKQDYLSKATDNIVLQSFWTDAEPGLINAVSQVFPNTQHFYCLFYIWQNIVKHLKASLVEEAIDKRHEQKIRYCKLTDIKAQYKSIRLSYISSQFFSTIDHMLVNFLTPLILSLQRFQISQSFTYEGQREHIIFESSIDTAIEVNLNLQSLRNFQGSSNHASIQQVISKRNKFGVAFLTAKTAINIALKTK
ncbi:16033_t:CDS:2, partial [Racocetra persica]